MKQIVVILILPSLLSGCAIQSIDFEYEMKGIKHSLHLFPDSTFVESQHWADSSVIYSGQWYGVPQDGDTIRLISNREGLEMMKRKLKSSFVVTGDSLVLIEL